MILFFSFPSSRKYINIHSSRSNNFIPFLFLIFFFSGKTSCCHCGSCTPSCRSSGSCTSSSRGGTNCCRRCCCVGCSKFVFLHRLIVLEKEIIKLKQNFFIFFLFFFFLFFFSSFFFPLFFFFFFFFLFFFSFFFFPLFFFFLLFFNKFLASKCRCQSSGRQSKS